MLPSRGRCLPLSRSRRDSDAFPESQYSEAGPIRLKFRVFDSVVASTHAFPFALKSNIPILKHSYRQFVRFSPALVFFAGFACLLLSGCTKKSFSKSEQRIVTEEITAAAQHATSHKSEIAIRPEISSSSRFPIDQIFVTLPDPSALPSFLQSLHSIAHHHSLNLAESSSGGMSRFDFTFRGSRTHSVHVVTPLSARVQPTGPRSSKQAGSSGPLLAIIIDDLGYDRAAADSLLSLPFPLTVSVIPHLPLSEETAEEAYRRGDEVLLHLPMQSVGEIRQEGIELRPGMSAAQVDEILSGMLETVPHAVGVNNHQGSRATSDLALMEALMPALRARSLFFIDSRTTAATVAYATAERFGVRAASRKVFLDDDVTRGAILRQLSLAATDAQRDGSAIAIGHPHPETIAALADSLPRLESLGFRLVFASDLVH